jgi:hypothetical protein
VQSQLLTVGARIGQQQDQPVSGQIALFGSGPALDELMVTETFLGLDQGIPGVTCDQAVTAALVADDRNRDLGSPEEVRMQSAPKSFEERQVPGVARGIAARVQARGELQAKDGGQASSKVDREGGGIPKLRASYAARTHAQAARQLALTQAGRQPGGQELLSEPVTELPAASLARRRSRLTDAQALSIRNAGHAALIAGPRTGHATKQ